MKYSATEKEALAVVFGAKHFKHYLTGNHFTIISDARPLVWLNSIKDPTGKLAKWALELSNLKYTIKYRPGRMNQNADCLSRMLQITSEPTPVPLSTIEEEQAKDPFCQAVMKYLNTGEMDDPDYFPDWRKFIELLVEGVRQKGACAYSHTRGIVEPLLHCSSKASLASAREAHQVNIRSSFKNNLHAKL